MGSVIEFPGTVPEGREQLIDVADVAAWLHVSEAWVRDHSSRRRPLLPVRRIGGNLRYKPSEIQEFIDSNSGEIDNARAA